MNTKAEKRCDFCDKSKSEVKKMFAGPAISICNECVVRFNEKIDTVSDDVREGLVANLLSPQQIVRRLDQMIIGQDNAKKILAVAVYEHYRRLISPVQNGVAVDKSNICLIGPTGCGKTLLAKTLAKLLQVPFVIDDATTMTSAGYVGRNVEDVIKNLLVAADYDVEKAECGIVYIDEIDKVRKSEDGGKKDVGGEGVQQALLKMIEGSVVNITLPQKPGMPEKVARVDTSNILFIFGGRFGGLEKIISKRLEKNNGRSPSIGFGASLNKREIEVVYKYSLGDLLKKVRPEDLEKFGMISEFNGRVPVVATLHELDEEHLRRVLTEPRNAILKQFQVIFGNIELIFDEKAMDVIINEALVLKTGARGLRSIIERCTLDVRYEVHSGLDLSKCIITEGVIKGTEKARFVYSDTVTKKALRFMTQ